MARPTFLVTLDLLCRVFAVFLLLTLDLYLLAYIHQAGSHFS